MRHFFAGVAWLGTVCLALTLRPGVGAAPVNADAKAKAETPAEKTRRLLDQTVNVEFVDQTLQAVLDQLSEQTKVRFVLDRQALGEGDDSDLPVRVKLLDVKLRSALRSILLQHGLTFVVTGDTVFVTTEDLAFQRQLRQRVQVEVEDQPLATALRNLSRATAVNLMLDPRVPKPARETKVSLDLEDVPLEAAVFLLAELADLKSVRIGNVMFVTTAERAEKLRQDPDLAALGGNGGVMNISNDPDVRIEQRERILPNGRRVIEQVVVPGPGRMRLENAAPQGILAPPAPPFAPPPAP